MGKVGARELFVCIVNDGYSASLEKRKIYVALPDPAAEKQGLLRIIDESGDDYLYPKTFFRLIALRKYRFTRRDVQDPLAIRNFFEKVRYIRIFNRR